MYKLCDNPHDENSCNASGNRFLSKAAPKCDLIQAYATASAPVPINTPIPFTKTDYMSCVSSIKLDNNIFQIAECGSYVINYCIQVGTTEASRDAALAAESAATAAADARLALEAAKVALDAQEQAKEATIATVNLAFNASFAAVNAAGTARIVVGSDGDTADNRRLALEAADAADLAAIALENAIDAAEVKIRAAAQATEDAQTAADNAKTSAGTAKDNATSATQGLANAAYTNATEVANLAVAADTAAEVANEKEAYIFADTQLDVFPKIISAKYAAAETIKVAQYTRAAVTALEAEDHAAADAAAENAFQSSKKVNGGTLGAYGNAQRKATLAIQTAISAAIAVITAAEIAVKSAIDSAKAAEAFAQELAPAVVLRLKVPLCAHISPCGDCPPIDASTTGWTILDYSRKYLISSQSSGSISGTYQLKIVHPCTQVELVNDIQTDDTNNNTLTLDSTKAPNTYINIFRVCEGCCEAV